jgi:integrase
VLKNALSPACDEELVPAHLFARLGKVARPPGSPEPNLAWTDEEVEVVIQDAIDRGQDGLARAVALGRWAGYRRGTICEIKTDARVEVATDTGVERRLRWLTEKSGVLSDKLEDPRLTALLDRTECCGPQIAYNIYGGAWTPRQLSQALERVLERLSGSGCTRPGLSLHGLRHARGVELARVGASDAVIMAQLEHKTTSSARIYRRQTERAELADLGQTLIDRALQPPSEPGPRPLR